MKKLLTLAVLLCSGCAAHKPIPTCPAKIVVPHGCEARPWGNAVELDCKGKQPTIVYCDKLKQASPK